MLNFRKYGFKIFACALVAVMALIGAPKLGSFDKVAAYTSEEVSVANGTFVNASSSEFPKTPSDWSVVKGSYENSSIKAGVISTNVDDFLDNSDEYGLTVNPHTRLSNDDESILMINAKENTVRYGYSSKDFSFDANSYYVVSVDMRTYDSSVGSIYLNVDGEVKSSFVAKTTSGSWGWFRFFVSTNDLVGSTMSVEVWLGGKNDVLSNGVVFFDNISATRYTEADFYYEKENVVYDDSSSKFVDLSGTEEVTSAKITNANFEADEIAWQSIKNENVEDEDNGSIKNYTKSGVATIGKNYLASETGVVINPLTNNLNNNTKALFINNSQAAGFGYKSNKFTIERFSFYKLGVYVKTGDIEEGGASIRIVPTDDKFETFEFTNVKTVTETNSITNNWMYYSFYVAGSCFEDIEVELQLWLGNENAKTKGYVFFDDVSMYTIDYATFSGAAEGTSVKLASYLETKSEPNIKNSFFNIVDSSNEALPYKPANWEVENEDATGKSGIIVANKQHFNANKSNYGYITFEDIGYTRLQSDKSENATNNLLMIYNESADYQSYKSTSYSLTGGNDLYYKVSVDVKTLIANGVAYVDFIASGNGLFAHYDVVSNQEWATLTTYIKLGLFTQDVTVKLGLGTEDKTVQGYALFDNVIVETIDKDAYTEAKEDDNEYVKVIDFAKDVAGIFTRVENVLIGSEVVELGTPANYSFTASSDADVCDFGVIKVEGDNVIYINTTIDGEYTATSKISNTVTAGMYYKVVFTVRTESLNQQEANRKTKLVDEEEVVIPFGVKFGITENTTAFEGIGCAEKTEFTLYLDGTDITTVTPFVSLGYADAYTSGSLFVYSIEIEEVNAEDYKAASDAFFSEDESVTKDDTIIVLNKAEEPVEETPEEEEAETHDDTFDWLIVPSLITGVAILVALICVLVRKNKHSVTSPKGGKGKKKASYDRKKTLHPQVAHRQAEEARKAKLAEIEEKMRVVEQEIKRQEEEYALKREEQRKQKAEAKAEREFKAYAKKRAKLEKDKEKLQAEKEQTNSEEFLQKTEEKIIADYEKNAANEEVVDEQVDNVNAQVEEVEVEVVNDDKAEATDETTDNDEEDKK